MAKARAGPRAGAERAAAAHRAEATRARLEARWKRRELRQRAGSGGSGGAVIPDGLPRDHSDVRHRRERSRGGKLGVRVHGQPGHRRSGADILKWSSTGTAGSTATRPGPSRSRDSDDTQYATCARCVRIIDQLQRTTWPSRARWWSTKRFNKTTATRRRSSPISPSIEVTINNDTYISAPVENGACFHVASVTLDKPPLGWDCDSDPTGGEDLAYYQDGDWRLRAAAG